MRGTKAKKARHYAHAMLSKGLVVESNEYQRLGNGQIVNPRRKFYRYIKKEL